MSSASPSKVSASVLVLDNDDADRRFAEIQLSKTGRFQVEAAASVAAAMDILRGHLFDLILTEVELADADAYQFMKQLNARPGGRDLPVIFLTRDQRGSMLAAALQSGAIDFVGKPLKLAELLPRMDAVIRRNRARRLDMVSRSYGLAGDLSTITFPDLVHLLEIGNHSGQLFLTLERGIGEVRLEGGCIFDASFGSVVGEEAFFSIMREEHGRFEFQPGLPSGRLQRTIKSANTSLLMEGARLLDMHRMDAPGTDSAVAGAEWAARAEGSAVSATDDAPLSVGPVLEDPLLEDNTELPRPIPSSAECAEDLRKILEDPFSLAQMRYLSRGQLIEMTSDPEAAKRCLGVLIAPTLTGVSAFSGMAAPLGEREIASALDWDQRVLTLSLATANRVGLDVILLDCELPAMMLDGFRRGVSFAIYHPAKGDHYSMGQQSHVETVTVLKHLKPDALMALGGAMIGDCLPELCGQAGIDPKTFVKTQTGADVESEFRDSLASVLEVWGSLVGADS